MLHKEVIFLSHAMNRETPVYGGQEAVSFKGVKSIKNGDSCNTMYWSFSNHAGTHVDAPLHFIESGMSITDFNARFWIFSKIEMIEIVDIMPDHIISQDNLDDIGDCQLLLIKTGFEQYRKTDIYWRNSPALHPDLSYMLKEKCPSIKAVGVDFISIANLSNRELGRRAHREFLSKDILLIEDMKLSLLAKTPDIVIAAPLSVEQADAAPCSILAFC